MKKALISLMAIMTIMSCNSKDEGAGYIGPSTIQIENGRMTPETLLSFGRLSDPQLSPDGTTILYGVSYTSIEENRSCRNLFICNTDGSNRRQLTRYSKSVSNARWSLDGNYIFFLQGGQLYKAPYKNGKLGKKVCMSEVSAGISEFKLSPDQSRILYTSTIKNPLVWGPTDVDPTLDKAQAYTTEDLMYRHWDHWVTEIPRSYVANLTGGTITSDNSLDLLGSEPFELPTEPFGGVEQLSWAPDGRHIAYSCRKLTGKEYAFSTNSCIFIYDLLTGQTKEVTTSGGYDTDPSWSPDGTKLAWISMERDGYEADRQRLMVADINAMEPEAEGQNFGLEIGAIRELTEDFIYDVSGIFWTRCSGKIIFSSTIDGIGALCSVAVKKPQATIERLTPDDWWYSFGTPFALLCDGEGSDKSLLCTYQSMELPTELACVKIPAEGEPTFSAVTTENEHILGKIAPTRTEQIVLKTPQGEDLHCWVIYPPQFDKSKKWSGIEMFNGGPQSSLDQSWSYRWNFWLMAQQGYVVVLPNRHGDSGFGQPWKEQISGDYQGLNMEDYQIAGRWFKSQPWADKLAGVGASYGGFSVYNMMGIHGDLYDCFISHAGIFDERIMWYTTEEAWFGNWDNGGLMEYAYTPGQTGPAGDGITFGGLQQAGAPYANVAKSQHHYEFDPGSKVTQWHTPILCIHGMMDFRIPYTQGMAAFNAAQMMGVPSKLIIFPEECHWILQPQNALYWHREFFDWLSRWI
ncbi:MAG: prolyl oligopeptidase family serine peptidase [Bacteroidales bacterium]|nr:prolyl oligopeptidase family serine peptidase [Bacteroidales bacterium]